MPPGAYEEVCSLPRPRALKQFWAVPNWYPPLGRWAPMVVVILPELATANFAGGGGEEVTQNHNDQDFAETSYCSFRARGE